MSKCVICRLGETEDSFKLCETDLYHHFYPIYCMFAVGNQSLTSLVSFELQHDIMMSPSILPACHCDVKSGS